MNSRMQNTFTIGQLAKRADVHVETVRYYERKNLIERPPRPDDGFRIYPEDTLLRIKFIKRAQELGFTLEEIRILLSIEGGRCSDVREVALKRLEGINEKISDLTKLSRVLSELVEKCETNSNENKCPVVASIVVRDP